MKEAIILTKEEYRELTDTINQLQAQLREKINIIDLMDVDLSYAHDRINSLWNALNRPAIEAAAKAHDQEFYAWCDEMAEKYERQDEAEWIAEMSAKYNSGAYECAQKHNCSVDDLQWKIWAEHYVSPDQLIEKSHGWPATRFSCFYYWMFVDIANSYKFNGSWPNLGTHERELYLLMMHFASYHLDNTQLDRFWANHLAVEYGIEHI